MLDVTRPRKAHAPSMRIRARRLVARGTPGVVTFTIEFALADVFGAVAIERLGTPQALTALARLASGPEIAVTPPPSGRLVVEGLDDCAEGLALELGAEHGS